jgi:uncharacterized protein (DUF2384 family)
MVRRTKTSKRNRDESARLLRLALVFEKAKNFFEGDEAAARAWLNAPCRQCCSTDCS